MSNAFDDVSPGGSPIMVHSRQKDFTPAQGEEHIEAISAHIERHLGPVSGVFHEIISDLVHIDVHVVPANEQFPYLRLVTSGMSDLPMTVPAEVDADVPCYMELMVTLPADWPISQDAFEDERNYWPVRLLKGMARLPHEYDTWLGFGHTIPNGHPSEPYAPGVGFDGAIVLPPVTTPEDFAELVLEDGKTIAFMALMPLYPEEMDLKLKKGAEALLDRFDAKNIQDVIEPGRSNVAKKRFGLF
ncbi:suppressor of fused domain protein [Stenotrophomonas maltophilia]|uniref:suppressor of fused domain protein n=1 Tax=Stenotrophomonas maltophilia group TaxID=995085 RepID=UPI0015DEACE1|nr:suppressor of fused domain protein [Stenotrophomonas maltophilia]MBA0436121.1 suppressor of fused domain protein [Stenotrophomonas maltophilia]MDZ5814097.1 suppressor of fused domain protein [Stenotrophomonas maltophilia]HDS1677602.1 suppressor of fused domain protein [Stenotrophomonas maltophilia]